MSGDHQPVLCRETIDLVIPEQGKRNCFVDATFGRGGHTRALLERLGPDARVLGIDRDPTAEASGAKLAAEDCRFSFCHGPFAELSQILGRCRMSEIDGIVMDLGVSSPQLDNALRGFSFRLDGPIDMRMDTSTGEPAGDWLNNATEAEISSVLKSFGEDRFARRIARAIVAARPLTTTRELAQLIANVLPAKRESRKHPATRTFQALRIHINDELGQLDTGLHAAFDQLRVGGRLAIISFHSLEDGLVKRAFRELAAGPPLPRRLPVRASEHPPAARLAGGPVRPQDAEIAANPRARSATLRVLERMR